MASTDARPVPRKNTAYRVYFPILNNTGALVTGAAGLDSERSIDGAAFSDCTSEATEISQGIYYLDLTAAEMNGDAIVVVVKTTTTDAKTTTLVFYPEEIGDYRADVQQWLGTAVTAGTAGVPNVDITRIANAAVSTSTAQLGVNVINYGGVAGTFAAGRPEVNATHAAGTAWGSGAITAASIATGAITNVKFAAGAIDAAAVAADAIGASELAADAVTEIANGVWALDATGQQTAGTFGKALGDPLARTNSLMQSIPDAVGGAANGLFIAGTNAATTITTSFTTTFTGSLTGSVASVTGAVGSVTGSVGSVTGAVGSVTGAVGSVTGLTASNLDTTVSSRLAPTVAARTLDVSATGEAGIDWANVGAPTTSQTLSGTTVGTATVAGTVNALAANVITAAATAVDFATEINTGMATATNVSDVQTAVLAKLPAALVSGRIDASIGAVATDAINANALAADAVDEILDEVIEGTYTLRQLMRLMASALASKVSGAGTTTITFRDIGDTKNRIVATVDVDGNRTLFSTLDVT